MDIGADDAPPGPIVLMLFGGEGYVVVIDPALPSGNHRQAFDAKTTAWSYAQSLWCEHRLGFADHTTGNFGRIGGGQSSAEKSRF